MKSEFVIDTKIQRVILELFSEKINIPVGIYEKVDDKVKGLFPLKKYFADFCKASTTDPILKNYCEEDHIKRAFNGQTKCQQQCHFGLWNYCYPILINNNVRASILFGQRLINGQETASKKVFDEACKQYGLESKKVEELTHLFNQTPTVNLDFFEKAVRETVEHFYEQIKSIFEDREELNSLDETLRVKTQHIAHEFLLPVQSITANSEILAEKLRKSSELRDLALDIIMEMENLNLTAENLLGRGENYHLGQSSIFELLNSCKLLFGRFAFKKGIDILVNKPLGYFNPYIDGSKNHLLLAFKNLFHNAIKYSSGRHRYVKIDVEGFINSIRVKIANFGIGILEHEYSKIFEDGYRGELVRDLHRTGSGIGLSEVKKIISRHQGQINVVSTDEKTGYRTIFTVTLPRKQK
jgi:signal transduction histidine kinase